MKPLGVDGAFDRPVDDDAKRVFEAEGIGFGDILEIVLALRNSQLDQLSPTERKAFYKTARSLPLRKPTQSSAAVEAHLKHGYEFGLFPDPQGILSTHYDDLIREKLEVRRALAILSSTNPRVLAKAMGCATSTLYAYADPKRPNRPSPIHLYRAAHFLKLLTAEVSIAAESFLKAARASTPAPRGRPAKVRRVRQKP